MKPIKIANYAPRNHDAGNPTTGSPFLNKNAAGNLKDKVADEKDARAKAKDSIGKAKRSFHL